MKGREMIKVTSYTNPETITIDSLPDLTATTTEDGWKVKLSFRDENEMKALQDALNYHFPENMKTMQGMPTEEGYYLTQTGTLLYHDSDGDWSVRRPTVEDGQFVTVSIDRVWSDGLSASYATWPLVVSTFGAGAFPLVPVKFAD